MPRSKILFFITRAEMGGGQTHLVDLLRGLRASADVEVATSETGYLTEAATDLGVPWHIIPSMVQPIEPLKDARALAQCVALLRRVRPNLVHAHTSKAGFLARTAARLVGIPCVFTAHTWCFAEGTSKLWKIVGTPAERLAAHWCDRIINVSNANRALALQHKVGDADQHVTVHNGIPDVPQRALHFPVNVPRIVMVARFAPQKAQDLLVEALQEIDLPYELTFVGDGPTRTSVEQQVKNAGLSHKVKFAGLRMDIPELLASSDIFALFTHWEGFPISILESLRAGLPLVVSDVGGNREAVDPSCGCVVAPGDVTGFRDALRLLLANQALRSSMGRAARQRYVNHFTLDAMIRQTTAVYRSAMGSELEYPESGLPSTDRVVDSTTVLS